MAFILAHSQVYLDLDEDLPGYNEFMEILAKTPEDVYKTHLEQHSKWP